MYHHLNCKSFFAFVSFALPDMLKTNQSSIFRIINANFMNNITNLHRFAFFCKKIEFISLNFGIKLGYKTAITPEWKCCTLFTLKRKFIACASSIKASNGKYTLIR